jgi:hypothetical protein
MDAGARNLLLRTRPRWLLWSAWLKPCQWLLRDVGGSSAWSRTPLLNDTHDEAVHAIAGPS